MNNMTLNYHLMHPGGGSLPGDPNAAFYIDGTYHLHYIITHPWQEDGKNSFSFIHVTSPDMLHWTWQPTKLQPSFTGHGMFSGTGFITKDGKPAVIYYGHNSERNHIVIAKDNELSAWEKPYAVKVREEGGEETELKRHWDPDCFLIGDTYYAISGGQQQPLFKSTDLKNWILVGDFVRHNMPDVIIGEDISCANFFPLGDKWMLLCISHSLGCRYYLGDWDEAAEQFVPTSHGRMNWRRDNQNVWGLFKRTDFFAPESVLTPDGRRVMWAWLTSVGEENWLHDKTVQSLPRELSLAEDDTLRIKPLTELSSLRGEKQSLTGIVLSEPVSDFGIPVPPTAAPERQTLTKLTGESNEIRVTVSHQDAARKLFGFILFADSDQGGLPLILRPDTGTIRLGDNEAPFAVADLPGNEDVEIRIFIDRYLVEVFINDRQALLVTYQEYAGASELAAFTVWESTPIKSLDIWPLAATNQGLLEARHNPVWQPEEKQAATAYSNKKYLWCFFR